MPNSNRRRLLVLSAAALSLTATAVSHAAGPFDARRTIIEAPNGTLTEAVDVNNAGLVIGDYNEPDARPFAWSRSTGFVPLGGATDFSLARGLNECGQIVGELGSHAVRWNTFDEVEDLGTLGGSISSAADINDRGDVAGNAQLSPGGRHAPFLWTEEDGMRQILECEGQGGTATALNNARQVVGSCDSVTNDTYHAFFWSAETGRININLPEFRNTSATGINDRGEVVGDATAFGPVFRVFAFKWWPKTGRIVFLKDLGHEWSAARDINQAGLIVGDAIDAANARHAVGWLTPSWGGEVDPGIGVETTINALSDLGTGVGTVLHPGPGNLRAVVWEPPAYVAQALSKLHPRKCLRPAP